MNEPIIKEIIYEVLSELNREDCNTPVVMESYDLVTLDDNATRKI